MAKKYKCSLCGSKKHNKRTCPGGKKAPKERHFVKYLYTETRSGGKAINPEDEWTDYEEVQVDYQILDVFTDFTAAEDYSPYWERVRVDDAERPLEAGDTVYLVVIQYRTGDTFGSSTGNTCVQHVFLDKTAAYSAMGRINSGKYGNQKNDGYPVWSGYFDMLEGCTVQRFTI